jgi:threonine dehydratase
MVTITDIENAANRIFGLAHNTPVLSSQRISKICGCKTEFKCENFQRVGAFKFRGALNAVKYLIETKDISSVVTHSSGNHAQALALAAKLHNLKAWIVMPENAPLVKINAVKEYGAEIVFCEPTLEAREINCAKVIADTGAEFIHPYDNDLIIAGQGTCAMEIFRNSNSGEPEIVVAPVGGGGLLAGTAISTAFLSPKSRVYGAEPSMADDAHRSFLAGQIIPQTNPKTIADGLLTSLGVRNFEIIKSHVSDILMCSEENIYTAMKLIYENLKIVVEPSGAVGLAAVLSNPHRFKDSHTCIIISGGNIDITNFIWK